jgi:hypothetical protein
VDLDDECCLLARFGHGTWGHWLGEIVPMAAAVERYQPGRFRFAVPHHASVYGEAMRESLRAYGIDPTRLISLGWKRPIRLRNAWAISPIWSSHSPHPGALDIMRGAVRLALYKEGWERVALMRRDSLTRAIENSEEVEQFLRDAGFTIADAGRMTFLDQVRLFQSAKTLFAVIGSGLTGLIYSPGEVRVLAAGPARWGDRFFYALAQHRRARWAEARGPSEWNGEGLLRDAPFNLPLHALRTALTKLEARADASQSHLSISYY